MVIIGIVGQPAGGKSTVAQRLQANGATWINADKIAHQVLDMPEVTRRLVEYFGDAILDPDNDGKIDRARLGREVFGDDDGSRRGLTYLESVVHPETRAVITQRIEAALDQRVVAVILDIPLLFESHWDHCCDEVWCVDSDQHERRTRAARRGWDSEELARREKSQLDIQTKQRRSSVVIHNNGSLETLNETIDSLWSSILEQSEALPSPSPCSSQRPS